MKFKQCRSILSMSIISIVLLMACDSKKSSSFQKVDKTYYLEKADQIVESSAKTLASTLIEAIEKKGVEAAIYHCNHRALPLTDSLSAVHNASIKRTSLRYRNVQNRPTGLEEEILAQFEQLLLNDQSAVPIIQEHNGEIFYFSPIIMHSMCSNCHGRVEEISSYNLIKELYPADLATGYAVGDLRGMWSIKLMTTEGK